jgi:hypothetical protein
MTVVGAAAAAHDIQMGQSSLDVRILPSEFKGIPNIEIRSFVQLRVALESVRPDAANPAQPLPTLATICTKCVGCAQLII